MPKGIPISPRGSRIKKACEFCGEDFEVLPHSPQRFCNRSCSDNYKIRSSNENKKSDVWLICQNPKCEDTNNVDHVFLVPYEKRDKRFCSRQCFYKSDELSNNMKKLSQNPEFIAVRNKSVSESLKKLHQNPEFAAATRRRGRESMTKYNQSEKGRRTSSEMGFQKMTKLNQDPEFIEKRNKAATETINRLNQDPEFITKRNKATSDSLKKCHLDPEFLEKKSKRLSERMILSNQDPEFCRKRDEAGRKTIMRLFREGGFSFGLAQKMLFSRISELDPLLNEYLCMEKIVYLTDDIKSKYPGSNNSHYRVDIAFIVNDQIKLAIEVDGKLGHLTNEEIHRDQVRDSILMNEFGIKTIRVTNDQVFTNVNEVVELVMDEIQSII